MPSQEIMVKDVEIEDQELIDIDLCPECGGNLAHANDGSNELACKICGLVVEEKFSPETRIPMNETRSPTCRLVTDKSLGSYMGRNSLFKVVGKNYESSSGKGVPINQIKVLTSRFKHPIIERMDRYGSKLMDQHVNDKVGRESNISQLFAQRLGEVIDKVGLRLVLTNNGRHTRRMTEAAFLWVWYYMNQEEKKKKARLALRLKLWPRNEGVAELRLVNKIMMNS